MLSYSFGSYQEKKVSIHPHQQQFSQPSLYCIHLLSASFQCQSWIFLSSSQRINRLNLPAYSPDPCFLAHPHERCFARHQSPPSCQLRRPSQAPPFITHGHGVPPPSHSDWLLPASLSSYWLSFQPTERRALSHWSAQPSIRALVAANSKPQWTELYSLPDEELAFFYIEQHH